MDRGNTVIMKTKRRKVKYYIGATIKNNRGEQFEIVDKKGEKAVDSQFLVKSLKTGYERWICYQSIISKKFVDKYQTHNRFGGTIGDVNTLDYPDEFSLWTGMMERCHNPKSLNYPMYGGSGVEVCDRWKCFENFLEDIPHILGYNSYLFYNKQLKLDKDLSGKREYSLENCVFLLPSENNNNTRKQRREFVAKLPDGRTFTFNNKKQASKFLNIDDSMICKCLNKKRKHGKGITFEYIS